MAFDARVDVDGRMRHRPDREEGEEETGLVGGWERGDETATATEKKSTEFVVVEDDGRWTINDGRMGEGQIDGERGRRQQRSLNRGEDYYYCCC